MFVKKYDTRCSLAVARARVYARTTLKTFDALFNPAGIAVVGASQDASRHGGQLVQALAKYGYAGRVYPVNPRYQHIGEYLARGGDA